MTPVCACGREKIRGGRATQFWYCPPCNKARAKARYGRLPQSAAPVAGARIRLATYLQRHGDEALPRLLELLRRNADYGTTFA